MSPVLRYNGAFIGFMGVVGALGGLFFGLYRDRRDPRVTTPLILVFVASYLAIYLSLTGRAPWGLRWAEKPLRSFFK